MNIATQTQCVSIVLFISIPVPVSTAIQIRSRQIAGEFERAIRIFNSLRLSLPSSKAWVMGVNTLLCKICPCLIIFIRFSVGWLRLHLLQSYNRFYLSTTDLVYLHLLLTLFLSSELRFVRFVPVKLRKLKRVVFAFLEYYF